MTGADAYFKSVLGGGGRMKRNSAIYSYPFAVDIVVAVLLFVGRHSLASRGFDENVVGSILLCYGIGYCVSSLFMRRIVRVRQARWQMAGALVAVVVACCWLANTQQVREDGQRSRWNRILPGHPGRV